MTGCVSTSTPILTKLLDKPSLHSTPEFFKLRITFLTSYPYIRTVYVSCLGNSLQIIMCNEVVYMLTAQVLVTNIVLIMIIS